MTAHKKHRHHDLRDRAKVEASYVEAPFSATTKIVPPTKKSKKNPNIPAPQASTRAHEYEFSPSIQKLKGVGAKLQRQMPNKIARQRKNSPHL